MNHPTNIIDEEEIISLIALSLSKGIGNIGLKKLIEEFKSAKAIWKNNFYFSKKKPDSSILENLKNKDLLFERATNELNYAKTHKIKILHYLDKKYPSLLRHCKDAPIFLFQKGNIDFQKRKLISIVGTRNMTSYGEKIIEKLIDEITPYNPIILSGLAYGVDAKAHKKALENGLDTLAVLAHGLHKIYPADHFALAKKIEEKGALLSEYCTFDKMRKENFPLRNRIIAGIAQGVIIIEGALKGGSMLTAKYANEYNREVFALAGRIDDPYSLGTNELIKTHQASILTSARDIEEMLGWDQVQKIGVKKEKIEIILKKEELFLQGNEKLIYELLKKGKMHLDKLHENLEIPINELMNLLFSLEIKDLIKSLEGKYFELKN